MAKKKRELVYALEIIVAVLSTIIEVLENQQASEDTLLEKGGSEND